MVPASAAAVATFFLLVAPGISYELLRERTRQPREDSTFVEVSRVLLAGMLLTAATLLLLAAVASVAPGAFVDLPKLIVVGNAYLAEHLALAAWTTVVELSLAMLLAITASDVIRMRGPVSSIVVASNAWHTAFEGLRPRGSDVYVSIRMNDGTDVYGRWVANSNEPDPSKREILLLGPIRIRRPQNETTKLDERWRILSLSGFEISSIAVGYKKTSTKPDTIGRQDRFRGWIAKHLLRWYVSAPAALVLCVVAIIVGRGDYWS